MPNYTGGADTICPFYLREDDKSITCEGFLISAVLTMKFKKSPEKRSWQEKYCFEFTYGRCPIAEHLLKQYESTPQITEKKRSRR